MLQYNFVYDRSELWSMSQMHDSYKLERFESLMQSSSQSVLGGIIDPPDARNVLQYPEREIKTDVAIVVNATHQ